MSGKLVDTKYKSRKIFFFIELFHSVWFELSDAPVVDVSPGNATVNETEDILIFCLVDANPPELSSVRW